MAYRYRGANTDWISHLPPEIIEKILTLLPIRDAVRTSILSSAWRYKWISMSDLNFGEGWGRADKHVKFIDHCLLVHQGPIRKFNVKAYTLTVGRKIDQRLRLVSKQDMEELQVVFGGSLDSRVPSCLFHCKKLTHLELSYCHLDVPRTFEGFLNLKILKLSVRMVDNNIEMLISKSPLLETLNLYSYRASNDMVTIYAPKINYLSLQGHYKDICLEKSPLLVNMSLELYDDQGDNNLIKVLGGAPNLETLTVQLYVAETKIRSYKGAIFTTLNYLKVMTLSEFGLGEREGIPLVLELLISTPNLEKLVIQCRTLFPPPTKVDKDFWKKECPHGHGFMKLKVIEMGYIFCVAPEIEFAKFMLSSSPVLEKMEINTHERSKVTVGRMLKNLPKLQQACPRAAVTFHHK